MGIFDEAIREHLELKRQHGAGDSELRDLEDEAFGPPARPGDVAVAEQPADTEAEAPTELASIQEVPDLVEPAAAEVEIAEADAEAEVPEIEEPPSAPSGDSVALETEEHPPPEGASEPEPEPVVEPEAPAPVSDQETELFEPPDAGLPVEDPGPPAATEAEPLEDEFFSEQSLSDELDQALDAPEEGEPVPAEPASDVEEPPAAAEPEGEASGDEDVLEETPEFLEDTPESDRLWFEQRPPKDFDFDD
jgi:hypothetical protein